MTTKLLRFVSLTTILTLWLAGCSRPVAPHEPPPPVSPYDVPATVLWTSDAEPIGMPSVGATEFVSYVRTANGIAMASYDLATGKELWRDDAVPGMDNSADQVAPIIERDGHSWTAYWAPHEGEILRLKVVDARTGAPVALSTDLIWATSTPNVCKNPTTSFCFTGTAPNAPQVWGSRGQMDPVTGEVSLGGAPELPVKGAGLRGEHVYTLWGQEVALDELGYAVDGAVRWRRSYPDVFGPGSSSTYGSWWIDSSDRTVIVGASFDAESAYEVANATGTAAVDLATTGKVVGLDPMTGATLWSLAGAGTCNTFGKIPYPPAERVLPICRFTKGTMILTKGSNGVSSTYADDLSYELTGVEVTSGRVVWTVPLHRDVYLQRWQPGPRWLSASSEATVVALSPTLQWELVDRATGAVTTPGSTTVMACLTPRKFLVTTGRTYHYYAGASGYPCRGDRTESLTWSVGAAQDVGVSASDGTVRIVSAAKGFVALRVGQK